MTAAFLLALFAAGPSNALHPSWMVGRWGWQAAGEKVNDCGSDHTTTYYRDGTYEILGETGLWRIEGNRLIETDPAGRCKPIIIRFKRIRPGVLRVGGEYPGSMIKCPSG